MGGRKKHILGLIALSFIPLIILFFKQGAASQGAVRLPKPLQYEVGVALKLVQVYVTDKRGNNVVDLNKNDFVLADNGKVQNITDFEVHTISIPVTSNVPAEKKATPKEVDVPGPLMGRKIFMFFDFAFSTPSGAEKAKKAALDFLDKRLQPSDEVGIVSYSAFNQGLKIHEFLTTDHRKVRQIVDGFGLQSSNGRAEDFAERYRREREYGGFADASTAVMPQSLSNPDLSIPTGSVPMSPAEGTSDIIGQAKRFSKALTKLAQALRYVPGQKDLVLFSGGVPSTAIYGELLKPGQVLTHQWANSDVRYAFEDMCKELATSNITVYALNSDPRTAGGEGATGSMTLKQMTNVTGGEYYGNIDNYEEHLDSIQKRTAYYYVLGYSIAENWNGKFHKIKVQTTRPGLEVQAQTGYYSPRPFPEYTDFEKELQLVDLALNKNPLYQTPVRLPMMSIAASSAMEGNLCLIAKIPVAKIQNIAKSRAEIVAIVFNAQDDIVDLKRTEEDLSPMGNESAHYFSFLSAPPGVYQCRIVVRNLSTGAGSVGASSAIVPEKKEKGLQLYLPVILQPNRGAKYLKGYVPRKMASLSGITTPAAILAGLFGFDPRLYTPLIEGNMAVNGEVWVAIRCAAINIQSPDIRLSVTLTPIDGHEETPVQSDLVDRKKMADAEVFFLKIQIPSVTPGNYMLNFAAEDLSTGTQSKVGREYNIR